MKHWICSATLLCLSLPAAAQVPASWIEPVDPVRIVGNVYYVGTADLMSLLITTSEGHILIDAPLDENVPRLLASIEAIGFDPRDIRILLNTHAHYDHAGGLAQMKEVTGARLLASAPSAELLARGGRDDFAYGDKVPYPPVVVDEIVGDGDVIALGDTRLTAIATPGHTRGGTSWTLEVPEDGKTLRVLVAESLSAPGYQLFENERYPEILDDFRSSFDRLRAVEADVFISTHGSNYDLIDKLAAVRAEGTNPFIDSTTVARYAAFWLEEIEGQWADQQSFAAVDTVLDRFHRAAAEADGETYFGQLESQAVFIGTDPGERWSVREFRAFAEPYFERGEGWTYMPTERHFDIDEDGSTVWFDEMLENETYGTTRGTGVVMKTVDGWKIVQYHLAIPVPNALAQDVVALIRGDSDARKRTQGNE